MKDSISSIVRPYVPTICALRTGSSEATVAMLLLDDEFNVAGKLERSTHRSLLYIAKIERIIEAPSC